MPARLLTIAALTALAAFSLLVSKSQHPPKTITISLDRQ